MNAACSLRDYIDEENQKFAASCSEFEVCLTHPYSSHLTMFAVASSLKCCVHAKHIQLTSSSLPVLILVLVHVPPHVKPQPVPTGIGMQSTQQKVREAVKEQQNTVRNILQLAPVPPDEPDCRYF